MPRPLTVTFDYRCPFAYNGNAAVVNALRQGVDLDVRFAVFSLDQNHAAQTDEDAPPVWERPPAERGSGVLALLFGIAVRDHDPDRFLDAHPALFAARHDEARDLRDEAVLRDVVAGVGCDPDRIAALAHDPGTLATLAAEHTEMVREHSVFGVPTFVTGDSAVFVRFLERGRVDDLLRMLDLLDWTGLNEFKRTTLPF